MKESAANAAASTKAGMEKAKATTKEKVIINPDIIDIFLCWLYIF